MEVLPTTQQTYREVARVLGRAFGNEAVSVAVYKNFLPEKRIRALTLDFSAELLICIHKGYPIQVNEDGKIVAAAVIYPPGSYPLPAIDQWIILLKSILGNGLYDFRGWVKWLDEIDKNHPTEAHFYLEYIGVEPGYQGKGYGSLILEHLINKADNLGVGCYLETADARNLSFYQHFGFQIKDEKEIIGIPTWFMWRQPELQFP
jgi:GNAT superfamily N-acetyltransferase